MNTCSSAVGRDAGPPAEPMLLLRVVASPGVWGPRLLGEFRLSPVRTLLAAGRGRRVLVGRRFRIRGAARIRGRLFAGLLAFGFLDVRRGGLIRVDGRLVCEGHVDVAHGNEWHVDEGAVLTIGHGTMFSPYGRVYARTDVRIGAWTAIGWETQILDDNQHPLTVDGATHAPEGRVVIGDHVWIGSRVSILQNTVIGDGCIVAAGAVVKGDFSEPNCLLGGVPAVVIRRGVSWRFERDGETPVHGDSGSDPFEPVPTGPNLL